ncbi:MAG: malate synthase A [Planctomycetes bacterium]|nr:malate synthase A [Planctomycetota bacterium]
MGDPSDALRVARLLPAEARDLLLTAHRALASDRRVLLEDRKRRQDAWDAGELPGRPVDAPVEARGDWRVAELPQDLMRRRVEITGPISDPKMVINMLSRGADGHMSDAAMLDFEDSMKPTWENVLLGFENLTLAARGDLTVERPGKTYRINRDDMPLLMVLVCGLHIDEANIIVDGEPIAAGIFDLVLTAYHTARELIAQGKTPKIYVPKCEHFKEARWWNRLFNLVEEGLELKTGAIRATFLIETLPAAMQVEEILYELRTRAAALNVGRWDKIFSDIKVLREHPDRVLADRGSIGMDRPWMSAYARRLIHVCHRHGAFAMGGMAAFTPGNDAATREEQTQKVVLDKHLEATMGHDGCWVSHPYFIGPALSAFENDHQLDVLPVSPTEAELLPEATGPRSIGGLRKNAAVAIAYLKGWSEGKGCVAWDGLMEDLATLEISRAQTWQWLRHRVRLDDGAVVTPSLVRHVLDQELLAIARKVRDQMPEQPEQPVRDQIRLFALARRRAEALFLEPELRPFLTTDG